MSLSPQNDVSRSDAWSINHVGPYCPNSDHEMNDVKFSTYISKKTDMNSR